MMRSGHSRFVLRDRALAVAVHVLTASGAVWGVLALLAISAGHWKVAFAWMGLSLAIDMVDGSLARRVGVRRCLPSFDGALLDNLVDFLNYVLVPAFFVIEAGLVPAELSWLAVALLCLSSGYQFCQADAKTTDHYFKGFPSFWNVAVFYLFLLDLREEINLALLAGLAIAVFVPIKYIYPSRTVRHRRLTLALTGLWAATSFAVVWRYPEPSPWLLGVSIGYLFYYVGLSLYHQATSTGSARAQR